MILPAQRIVEARTGRSLKIRSASLSHRFENKMFETVNLADPYISLVCRKEYIDETSNDYLIIAPTL